MSAEVSVARLEAANRLGIHDVDQMCHAVSGSNLEIVQLDAGRIDAQVGHQTCGELLIDHGIVNLPVRVQGSLDPQRFSLGMLAPHARATWNGNAVDSSGLPFFMPGRELNGFTAANYGWTSLVLPATWVESIALSLWRPDPLQLRADCRILHPNAAQLTELWRSVRAIVNPEPKMVNASDTTMWLMTDVRNALGSVMIDLDQPHRNMATLPISQFRTARSAERFMRERIGEPLSIDEVCVALRVSRRYLEYSFAQSFGTSPSRYLRLLRLHEVRRRLKASGGKTNVTREAYNLGFNHLGLFSGQYKTMFGESPSTTLAATGRNFCTV